MQGLGLAGTKLRRHMMDTAAARRGDENVSTPDELVRLLKTMNDAMPEAIALLKKPKENRLRKGLPEGVASADKSGELEGVRVDAGIVFAKNRPVRPLRDDDVPEGRSGRGAGDRRDLARRPTSTSAASAPAARSATPERPIRRS